MSFSRLIHDYIDDLSTAEDFDTFDLDRDFDHDFDHDFEDDDINEHRGRRHRRSGRRRSGRHGSRPRGRASRRGGDGRRRDAGSAKDLVRLVVLAAVALTVIRRLSARRRSRRSAHA